MALKPTIYKLKIDLSDINRNYYDALNLTLALHPSETPERMMARVVAYCINAQEGLQFTKGLSAVEEPDLWVHTLDNQLALWVDVGEPAAQRIKKATGLSPVVKIYCFNSKSNVWWEQSRAKLSKLNVSVYQFPWQSMQSLAVLVRRTMDLSITLSDDSVYIAAESGECEVVVQSLQQME